MTPAELHKLIDKVESAINAHSGLVLEKHPCTAFCFSRDGVTVRIRVKATNTRKRNHDEIWASSDTAKATATELIRDLDYWAQAIR
jgi:hypothetical protein